MGNDRSFYREIVYSIRTAKLHFHEAAAKTFVLGTGAKRNCEGFAPKAELRLTQGFSSLVEKGPG